MNRVNEQFMSHISFYTDGKSRHCDHVKFKKVKPYENIKKNVKQDKAVLNKIKVPSHEEPTN